MAGFKIFVKLGLLYRMTTLGLIIGIRVCDRFQPITQIRNKGTLPTGC